MSRYLVAGGAGFVGSHLVDALMRDADAVVVVDDYSSGSPENLTQHAGDDRLTVIEANIAAGTPPHMGDHVFTHVLNLASPASPPDYLDRPIETLLAGSRGNEVMLDVALAHGARYLLTSTSEVYGDPLVHPQPESYWGNVNPVGPRSVYDESKRFAEAMTMAYHRTFGLDVRIARLFNTYGPRLRPSDGRVVSNFVAQALAGQPLTVFGDGSQTRSFGYVDDTVSGLMALLNSDVVDPVNIGNPDEFTMLELAEMVGEVTGRSVHLEHRELPADDPTQRRPDVSLAADRLGWAPSVDLRTGLGRYVEWVRSTR